MSPPTAKTFRELEELQRKSIKDLTTEEILDKKSSFQEFDDLLGELSTTDSKIKSLWKEIYRNSVLDRVLSHQNLTELMTLCSQNPQNHAVHGPTIARYLERMEKATNQLIKLAELVEEFRRRESTANGIVMTEDEIYDKIDKGKPS